MHHGAGRSKLSQAAASAAACGTVCHSGRHTTLRPQSRVAQHEPCSGAHPVDWQPMFAPAVVPPSDLEQALPWPVVVQLQC